MSKTKISKSTIKLIEEAIENSNSNDRFILLSEISNIAVCKYPDLSLENQLRKMNLSTTTKILEAIDTYFELKEKKHQKQKTKKAITA